MYGWKLYVDYGDGWEYEIFEQTRKGFKENAKLYRQNCPFPQKWSTGRETNPEHKSTNLTTVG